MQIEIDPMLPTNVLISTFKKKVIEHLLAELPNELQDRHKKWIDSVGEAGLDSAIGNLQQCIRLMDD